MRTREPVCWWGGGLIGGLTVRSLMGWSGLRRGAAAVLAVAVLAVVVVGATRAFPASTGVSARALLNELPVAVEYEAGYARQAGFGGWQDLDGDGCDTRAEVLLAEATRKPRVHRGCVLVGGRWTSKWDGLVVRDPGGLQIDHVVSLVEVWRSGGYAWSQDRREAYMNDVGFPGTLLAVSNHTNMSKGDRGPGQWTPDNAAAGCWFVTDWIAVKWRWGLSVDSSEKAELGGLLSECRNVGEPVKVKKPVRA